MNSGAPEGRYDMRDLGALLDHEDPLPRPASNQAPWCCRIISAASSCVGAPVKFARTTRPR
jgi:hypothetical protein